VEHFDANVVVVGGGVVAGVVVGGLEVFAFA